MITRVIPRQRSDPYIFVGIMFFITGNIGANSLSAIFRKILFVFLRRCTNMLKKCSVKGSDTVKAAALRRLGNGYVILTHKPGGFVDAEDVYIASKIYFQLAAKYMRYIAFAYKQSIRNISQRNIRAEILLAIVQNFNYNTII